MGELNQDEGYGPPCGPDTAPGNHHARTGTSQAGPAKLTAALLEGDHGPFSLHHEAEALARLTGAVAHAFNNLLTVVLGNAGSLRISAAARGDNQAIRQLEMIEQAARRGGRMTGQLLAFSGKQILIPRDIAPVGFLQDLRPSLMAVAGTRIVVQFHFAPDAWVCRADPAHLEQAVVNLVLNACDAMPGGGAIQIECRNEVTPPQAAHTWNGSEFVRISVADTGHGMSRAVRDRAFEPFFTTKPFGQGSGLGLAQVYGFAAQSGGWTEVRSEPDQGTEVCLYLPRARPVRPIKRLSSNLPNHGDRPPHIPVVLLVESDPELRDTVKEALDDAGLQAVVAPDAPSARLAIAGCPALLAMVSEAVLPDGESGTDLGFDVIRAHPDAVVLLVAGETIDAPQGECSNRFPRLVKPYRTADIIALLQQKLPGRPRN